MVLTFSRLFGVFHTDQTYMSAITGNAMCSNGQTSNGRDAVWPAALPTFASRNCVPAHRAESGAIEPAVRRRGDRSSRITRAAGLATAEGFSLVLAPGAGG